MGTVIVDALPSSVSRYREDWTIVIVDVIRFTTTAATALAIGRSVYPARSSDEASTIAAELHDPLLAGELGGNVPYGFDLSNSPVEVVALRQVPCGFFTAPHRPIVLVSSSGAQLTMNAIGAKDIYMGCLRNLSALVELISLRHDRIAVLGAGSRGQFRREDQLCCAWIAERLIERGFEAASDDTSALVQKWHAVSTDAIRDGRSADYLRRTGQVHDLEFILHYQEDLRVVPRMSDDGSLIDVTG